MAVVGGREGRVSGLFFQVDLKSKARSAETSQVTVVKGSMVGGRGEKALDE